MMNATRRLSQRPRLQRALAAGLAWAALALLGAAPAAGAAGIDQRILGAVVQDNGERAAALVRQGADPNAPNDAGNPPLHIAIQEGSWEAAAALAAQPQTDIDRANANGETPLMLAALKGRMELVQQLIARGASVNRQGWTPLHYAASAGGPGQTAIIGLLLEHYAFINARSPNETTPLMMAAGYGSAESVKLLIAEGAFPDARNQQGLTAADFALRANRTDVAELIGQALRAQFSGGKW